MVGVRSNSSVVWLLLCFKQKTAYEMRISDWSSDVCSSDLGPDDVGRPGTGVEQPHDLALGLVHPVVSDRAAGAALVPQVAHDGLRSVTMTIGSPHPAHSAVMRPT